MTEGPGASRIGILWRGDRREASPRPRADRRLEPLYDALGRLPVTVEFVPYDDDAVDEVRERLLTLDAVLVWVNPIQDGQTRRTLDDLLREAAAEGVWVSAHPDVTARLGTKEVLYATRTLAWGSDTELYPSVEDFQGRFPARLAHHGRLVVKQARGNGGNGVWKVELPDGRPAPADPMTLVRVQDARTKDSSSEHMTLAAFMRQGQECFAWSGSLVDQVFQERLGEGMIRCYFSGDDVVGFCHQWPTALLDEREQLASPRPVPTMEAADAPAYQALRTTAESEWVPQLLHVLSLRRTELPAIWDADFLYGPPSPTGEDSYVLCEINVSAVWPFPPTAAAAVAQMALDNARLSRDDRRARQAGKDRV